MRTALVPVAPLVVVLAVLAGAACVDPPPETQCEGPDPSTGTLLPERGLDAASLGESCADPAPPDGEAGPFSGASSLALNVSAGVVASDEALGALFGCDVTGQSAVDFTREEVVVLTRSELVAVDGVFDVDGQLVVAASSDGNVCRGAPPRALEGATVLERTGDAAAAIRSCVTTDPPPPSLLPSPGCLAP